MRLKSLLLATALLSSSVIAAKIDKIVVNEQLDKIQSPKKTLVFDVGIGSGAFHFKKDSKNVFYSITDRGVNIKCKDSEKLLGEKVCKKGKIFPVPNFAPTIYKFKLSKKGYEVLEKIQIKDKDGNPVTGISNPNTEKSYNLQGKELKYDPNGLDAESLVRMSDGTFWIGEEYGGSILHITADGKILKRVVPKGFEKNLTEANYEVSATLPAIIAKRPLNRGIESISVSPDEKSLYFIMQSPLANPNPKAYKASRNVRVFKYDIASNKVIAEYVYKMDLPNTFKLDKNKKQSAVKLSEMVCIGNDTLIVLERISKTTKFYKIKLKGENILGSKWDNENTSPSLEQTKDIKSLKKTLVLDTSNIKGMPKKIEGLAYIDAKNWIVTNDNDFGIEKDKEYIVRIKF